MEAVRHLLPGEAEDYWTLRLEALRLHPEAYGSDAIEVGAWTVADFAQRLVTGSEPRRDCRRLSLLRD